MIRLKYLKYLDSYSHNYRSNKKLDCWELDVLNWLMKLNLSKTLLKCS